MSVECKACGKTSEDEEFCDHCNADLADAPSELPPAYCPLSDSGVELSEDQRRELGKPEASLTLRSEYKLCRVHWISEREVEQRRPMLERRRDLAVPSLPRIELHEGPGGLWVFADCLAQPWTPWARASRIDPLEHLFRLVNNARKLVNLLEELHRHNLVWLTFDPVSLEEGASTGGEAPLLITNLDLQVYPAGELPGSFFVHHSYAAPEIYSYRAADVGPRTDVFHLAMFAYYWLGGMLPEGFLGAGLESFLYQIPFLRIYAPQLPEGIVPVIMRGLELEASARYASPREFVQALHGARDAVYARRSHRQSLRWDIGAETRKGRLKAALGGENEDSVVVLHFEKDRAALVAVADGVSSCHIGSGALASLFTTVVIDANFAEGSSHERFPTQAAQTCQQGAQWLVDWAIEKGYKAQLQAGADLMGTTLLLGWLQGERLSLANLGDSRAFLITPHAIEQLTVDGDLASTLLARHLAPEEVRELGIVGKSLRECVGGCVVGSDGEVRPMREASHPAIQRWHLQADDILVLCTDGLVEEGVFLDPPMLFKLVDEHREKSAAELALLLTDAADAMQHVPTPADPAGLGDNISCIVVKVLAG